MEDNSTIAPLAVNTTEAARMLNISRPTLYRLIHQQDFPSFKVGGRTLISVEGLRDWVRRQLNEQSVITPPHYLTTAATRQGADQLADSDAHKTHVLSQ